MLTCLVVCKMSGRGLRRAFCCYPKDQNEKKVKIFFFFAMSEGSKWGGKNTKNYLYIFLNSSKDQNEKKVKKMLLLYLKDQNEEKN